MIISILKTGFSTIQDLGRPKSRAFGVPVGGAVDVLSHRVANLLVQNGAVAATLEVVGGGFRARVEKAGWLAYTGAGSLFVSGAARDLSGRLICLPEKTEFEIQAATDGTCGYLSVPGGWALPLVLESASTCLAAGFGGLEGRILLKGDFLQAHGNSTFPAGDVPENLRASRWYLDLKRNNPVFVEKQENIVPIRFIRGPEWDWWAPEQQQRFCAVPFVVARARDRMGIRLEGEALPPVRRENLLSTGISIGAIQVPPDGKPIVLLADAQTTGGYPRIGQVIDTDVGRMAQIPGGQPLRFQAVELREAESLLFRQAAFLRQLEGGLRIRLFEDWVI